MVRGDQYNQGRRGSEPRQMLLTMLLEANPTNPKETRGFLQAATMQHVQVLVTCMAPAEDVQAASQHTGCVPFLLHLLRYAHPGSREKRVPVVFFSEKYFPGRSMTLIS
jgi:hypothetical protein